MKKIVRSMFYFFYSIKIKVCNRKVRVSLTSRIRPKSELEGPISNGAHTYFRGKIGMYSYIGENCRIYAKIGRFCSISSNVKIVEATHPINFVSTSPSLYSSAKQCNATFVKENLFDDLLKISDSNFPCEIGNDVWIGENVMIKGGIKIGDGACIAMGAVVVKDVPPYAVVGGVPAKIIKYRFDNEIIEDLKSIKWWDKSDAWIRKRAPLFLDVKLFLKEVL